MTSKEFHVFSHIYYYISIQSQSYAHIVPCFTGLNVYDVIIDCMKLNRMALEWPEGYIL